MNTYTLKPIDLSSPLPVKTTEVERAHPLRSEYRRYVHSMHAALLNAYSFEQWLNAREERDERTP